MDDGRRKKKNKKNKGKPTKAVDNASVSGGGAPVMGDAHGQNHHIQNSGTVDTSNAGVSESETELEQSKIDEEKSASLEKIEHLQYVIDSYAQKEASLRKEIDHLKNEHDSFIQKEASWDMKIEHLHGEINSLSIKVASLEDNIKHLEDKNDSRILKENSIKEMVARLENTNMGLQMQVKELEESRYSFVQENRQLVESITAMESRIQHIEREVSSFGLSSVKMTEDVSEDKKSLNQMELAHELVERPVAENSELVKKVNGPYFELDHHTNAGQHPALTEVDSLAELEKKIVPGGISFKTSSIDDDDVDLNANGVHLHLTEPRASSDESGRSEEEEEIVQVPLDETQQVEDAESPPLEKVNEKSGVPLSDAPLIGAPFRLISFFTKYVSGADLVKEEGRPASRSG